MNCPGWSESRRPTFQGIPAKTRCELTKGFQVSSRLQALLNLCHRCVPQIDAMDHHPRWENLWRSLIVSLTTWDIGHEISDGDVRSSLAT